MYRLPHDAVRELLCKGGRGKRCTAYLRHCESRNEDIDSCLEDFVDIEAAEPGEHDLRTILKLGLADIDKMVEDVERGQITARMAVEQIRITSLRMKNNILDTEEPAKRNETILVRRDDDYPQRIYVERILLDDGVRIDDAIRGAVKEYLSTPEGKKYLDDNNGCFNYADAIEIPDVITQKHGYTVTQVFQHEVDSNEDLVPKET